MFTTRQLCGFAFVCAVLGVGACEAAKWAVARAPVSCSCEWEEP